MTSEQKHTFIKTLLIDIVNLDFKECELSFININAVFLNILMTSLVRDNRIML